MRQGGGKGERNDGATIRAVDTSPRVHWSGRDRRGRLHAASQSEYLAPPIHEEFSVGSEEEFPAVGSVGIGRGRADVRRRLPFVSVDQPDVQLRGDERGSTHVQAILIRGQLEVDPAMKPGAPLPHAWL